MQGRVGGFAEKVRAVQPPAVLAMAGEEVAEWPTCLRVTAARGDQRCNGCPLDVSPARHPQRCQLARRGGDLRQWVVTSELCQDGEQLAPFGVDRVANRIPRRGAFGLDKASFLRAAPGELGVAAG